MNTETMKRIVRDVCIPYGMPVYYSDELPNGEIVSPRITVSCGRDTRGKHWNTCKMTVSVCIPSERLHASEWEQCRDAEDFLRSSFDAGIADTCGDDAYSISVIDYSTEYESKYRTSVVSAHILFSTLNTLKR